MDPLVHPAPAKPPRFYRWLVVFVRVLVRLFWRVSVVGLENLPQPPYIIAANHQAWYDPAFIIPFFPPAPMIYTMAKRETVFNRAWKRAFVTRIGVFPISPSRGELDEAGVRTVYQILARGGVVLMFPEGRYSRGRAIRELKTGIGYFALQAGVPVVPVAVRGSGSLVPFRRIEVSIGAPILPDPPAWWALSRRVATVVQRVGDALTTALQRRRRPPSDTS